MIKTYRLSVVAGNEKDIRSFVSHLSEEPRKSRSKHMTVDRVPHSVSTAGMTSPDSSRMFRESSASGWFWNSATTTHVSGSVAVMDPPREHRHWRGYYKSRSTGSQGQFTKTRCQRDRHAEARQTAFPADRMSPSISISGRRDVGCSQHALNSSAFSTATAAIFDRVRHRSITACGTGVGCSVAPAM